MHNSTTLFHMVLCSTRPNSCTGDCSHCSWLFLYHGSTALKLNASLLRRRPTQSRTLQDCGPFSIALICSPSPAFPAPPPPPKGRLSGARGKRPPSAGVAVSPGHLRRLPLQVQVPEWDVKPMLLPFTRPPRTLPSATCTGRDSGVRSVRPPADKQLFLSCFLQHLLYGFFFNFYTLYRTS